ncbi:hypothetical protein GQ57_34035 [Burkholderia sp. MSh2]|uniref:N-acetyltransferase domain-containing protein n=1 Tax=Burkholderia paludis TaxID=1506587 RepID=A0A6P2SJ93_9BURK|nr:MULTISPECIES: GNAT family N-acetyltransferase [Burkholderia]KEZ01662.1 hypothetical protein GQ57_34035 [Burkholderia sp. MSh2]CAB3759830.1 hypothetical protein LMG30113_03538 [Burkholderia paludis]VWC43906.1 hypothetical protein BPA30113_07137 [Burkholderia paludis]
MSSATRERSAQLWKLALSDCAHRAIAQSADLRHIQHGDASALGLLFFTAFHGTIDDIGQTEAQYASKATAILAGQYGQWISEASWTVEQTGGLQSACLVCDYQAYGCPVIAVIASAPGSQRLGAAGALLDAALAKLSALGHSECSAMITNGNVASERLFRSRGFSPHTRSRN